MTDRELMQMALAALERTYKMDSNDPQFQAVKALSIAVWRPEPEPVAFVVYDSKSNDIVWAEAGMHLKQNTPLYIAPPQRKWVGLTDEEYEAMAEQYVTNCYFDTLKYARAIEAKLKEKNDG